MISFFPRLWPKTPIFFLSLLTLLINSPPSALLQQQMMVFWKVHQSQTSLENSNVLRSGDI